MKNICLFGDSVGKGVIYDSISEKYMFLKNCFASIINGEGLLGVKNYSKFGCTITKGESIIRKNIADAQRADITVLEFGGNDCDFNWAEIAKDPTADHQPRTPLKLFTDKYTALIEGLKAKGLKVIVMNLPPIDERRYFDWFSRGLNKDNILQWLGSVDYVYRWHEMYDMQVCRIANAANVPLVDIRSAFLAKRNFSDYLCKDGIHPNEAGHALISEVIRDEIENLRPVFAV